LFSRLGSAALCRPTATDLGHVAAAVLSLANRHDPAPHAHVLNVPFNAERAIRLIVTGPASRRPVARGLPGVARQNAATTIVVPVGTTVMLVPSEARRLGLAPIVTVGQGPGRHAGNETFVLLAAPQPDPTATARTDLFAIGLTAAARRAPGPHAMVPTAGVLSGIGPHAMVLTAGVLSGIGRFATVAIVTVGPAAGRLVLVAIAVARQAPVGHSATVPTAGDPTAHDLTEVAVRSVVPVPVDGRQAIAIGTAVTQRPASRPPRPNGEPQKYALSGAPQEGVLNVVRPSLHRGSASAGSMTARSDRSPARRQNAPVPQTPAWWAMPMGPLTGLIRRRPAASLAAAIGRPARVRR
jgi:hypothetical protein